MTWSDEEYPDPPMPRADGGVRPGDGEQPTDQSPGYVEVEVADGDAVEDSL
jgi:hypothetical protein